jgi:hypothetical protein
MRCPPRLLPFQSFADGVGIKPTAVGKSTPFPRRSRSFKCPPIVRIPFPPSALRGVGQNFAAAGNPFRTSFAISPRFSALFARGVGQSCAYSLAIGVRVPLKFSDRRLSAFAVVVPSHNPNSVASVSGIDGASWNNKRLDGVTRSFQVRKTTVEFQIDDASNVLAKE